jgi:hypothetical protein
LKIENKPRDLMGRQSREFFRSLLKFARQASLVEQGMLRRSPVQGGR